MASDTVSTAVHRIAVSIALLAPVVFSRPLPATVRDVGNVSVVIDDGSAVPEGRNPSISLQAVGRQFYSSHPDDFDFLVIFADFENDLGEAIAFYLPIRNPTRGIGHDVGEFNGGGIAYGSAARLQGILNMNRLDIYPEDPGAPIGPPGVSPNTFALMGQELSHRWLVHMDFDSDPTAGVLPSNEMRLGRQVAHWNYYMDADSSVQDGMDWRDDGNGRFTAVGSLNSRPTFNDLDLYAMGALRPEEVRPWFLIQNWRPLFTGTALGYRPVRFRGNVFESLGDQQDFGPLAWLHQTTLLLHPGTDRARGFTVLYNFQEPARPQVGRLVFLSGPLDPRLAPGDTYAVLRAPTGPQLERVPAFRLDNTFDYLSGPRVEVTGDRRDLTIQDVIAAEGPRVPGTDQARKTVRAAYILVQRRGTPINAPVVQRIERIRTTFEAWFREHTRGRMEIDSVLTTTPPPDPDVPLAFGVAESGNLPAPQGAGGVLGATQYRIDVPSGATGLQVSLAGEPQNVDLFVRFGERVTVSDGAPLADAISASPGGTESVNITAAGNPPLREGRYFAAIGNLGPGAAEFTVTATVSTDPGPGPGPSVLPLVSGEPQAGSEIQENVLSATQYSIEVPSEAENLTVRLEGNTDVDLFVRFGEAVSVRDGRAVADYASQSATGGEEIVVTPASDPPLRPGRYFIAVANFGPGVATFTVTASVSRPPAPPRVLPPLPLVAGGVEMGTIPAPDPGSGLLGAQQYTIDVPEGATELGFDLDGSPEDVDLFVRFSERVTVEDGRPVVDHVSRSAGGVESLTITAASSPPLRTGTYFVAVANFGPGEATYDLSADIAVPPPASPRPTLDSGQPFEDLAPGSFPDGTGRLSPTQYRVEVPPGDVDLLVELEGDQDVDLFVRFGAEVMVQDGRPVADFTSESFTGSEEVAVSRSTVPPIRAGTYFVAIANFGEETANVTITATITVADRSLGELAPGRAESGLVPAPEPGSGLLAELQYRIDVPTDAGELTVELDGDQDVDLLVRFGARIEVRDGRAVADFASTGPDGMETLVIGPASDPPVKAGSYFIAVANFGPGAANYTLTATLSQPPPPTVPLQAGIAAEGDLPAPPPGSGLLGFTQYAIDVPMDASRLDVELNDPQADVDLFLRFGERVGVAGGDVVADHAAVSFTGTEALAVSPASDPPLRAGRYFAAVVNFGPGPAAFTIRANLDSRGERRPFHRGDADVNGTLNITDAVFTLRHLFLDAEDLVCREAADSDGNGRVNLTDAIYSLRFLFLGGPSPAPPGPPAQPCGPDPDPPGSPGDLGCDGYDSC